MNEQSEHLSNAQIENYGDRTSGAGPDADREAEQVEAHLQGCSSCRSRVLDFQRTRFALLADPKQPTDRPVNPASSPDCPSEDDLRQLAAGLLPEAVGAKLTRHAATCDHCGPLLRIYTEDFSDDFSQEEQAVLSSLQSSSARWQKKTAQQMLGAARATSAGAKTGATSAETNAGAAIAISPAEGPSALAGRSPLFWKWIIPAAAAACALIAFGIWYSQRDTPEKVEKLLAQAYTEQRTMEMRIPGAEYSDISQKRSGEPESILNLPASLRKSAELIDSQLKKTPDDPNWLLLKARLELLEWNYKQALSVLDKIDDTKTLESLEMRTTRALALYQQAELEPERRAQTYGEVINLFGKTLQSTPDDPTALFDRALACEKIYAYECASADFEHLLKIDTASGWSEEAKDHLNRIKEKKNLER